jgi:hypothetical protein
MVPEMVCAYPLVTTTSSKHTINRST